MDLTVAIPVRHDWQALEGTVKDLVQAGFARNQCVALHDADDLPPHTLTIRAVINTQQGFGGALRSGIAACASPWLAIVMADGCDKLADIHAMRSLAERDNLDIVIGARLHNSQPLQGQPRTKAMLVRTAAQISRQLGGVSDPSNNFRLYRVAAIHQMHLTETSPAIAVEILAQARAMGLRIGEIPTHWQEKRAQPSSRYLRHVPSYTKHYFRYMLNVLRG